MCDVMCGGSQFAGSSHQRLACYTLTSSTDGGHGGGIGKVNTVVLMQWWWLVSCVWDHLHAFGLIQ